MGLSPFVDSGSINICGQWVRKSGQWDRLLRWRIGLTFKDIGTVSIYGQLYCLFKTKGLSLFVNSGTVAIGGQWDCLHL